jgi:hypothetical protein
LKRLLEDAPEIAIEALVDKLEAAVVEAVLDEARVLPRAVQQDPRQGELGYAHEVLRPRSARNAVGFLIRSDRRRQRRHIDARFDLARERLEF